jgi:type IV pilus assembly protein PilB
MATKQHWIGQVLGSVNANGMDIPLGLSSFDAWKRAGEVFGIDAQALAQKVAGHFRLNVADIASADTRILKLVPEKLARRYVVFPLAQTDRQLFVATSDPTNFAAEQALTFSSGRTTIFKIAPPNAIQQAIERAYSPDKVVADVLKQVQPGADEAVHVLSDDDPEIVGEIDIDKAPVIKLSDAILRDAFRQGASDIHIEPGDSGGVVRYRVDGVLRQHMELPITALNRVVSRLKVMAKIDISNRLQPHDGHARVHVGSQIYDLRLSTVPTRGSEKAVIRILDTNSAKLLSDLAMPSYELGRFAKLLSNREGIILVTGPTGSGKTTTLYGALRELVTGKVNVTTVEDPVECQIPGVTQIQVDPKRDVTFASALRAILRQDPDVILVGEIRDLETAKMSVQAGMTGHLVLSTLHTNDAVGAIARLADIGLDHASIAASVRGIVAQRLVRRICTCCAEPIGDGLEPEEQRLAGIYGGRPKFRARGCAQCGYSGFQGRLPVEEIIIVTPQMQEAIAKGASPAELHQIALNGGMRPMRTNGASRVAEGLTTLGELDRVLGETGTPASAGVESIQPHALVVDDDPVSRQLTQSLLRKQGYTVTEAADGVDALDLLAKATYSLVVLDLTMPRLDGHQLLLRLRSSAQTANLPVIVLTGSTDDSIEAQLIEEGADDYIRKPLNAQRFVSRVTAVMRRAGA